MTPKEKAKQLVESFKFETKQSEIINDILLGDISVVFQHHKAKQCALIAVDEIINEIYKSSSLDKYYLNNDTMNEVEAINYWQEVKQEIEKL